MWLDKAFLWVYNLVSQKIMSSIVQRLKENWKSGLTVSLISIPLSVSLAVASQSTPVVGIITAIWAGLIASIFGGSKFNIVGPTGALSGILASYALTHGANTLASLAVVTGVYILIAYAFRLERYLVFISASTIHGFTLGVAFVIGFGQMNYALGLSGLPAHERFWNNLVESFSHLSSTSLPALVLFLFSTFFLFAFAKLLPKLPSAIFLAPIGIVIGMLSQSGSLPFQLITLGQKFEINPAIFLNPHLSFHPTLLSAGFTVAVIAILETMLSAKIADGMTKTKHNGRKEMMGLGLANIVSGLVGGIPATAALARTSLNVKTGGTNQMSATISSIAIAVIAMLLLGYFRYIPMAVIAAILVYVAIRMIEREHFERMWKFDRRSFALSMVVAALTVYIDPIIGILVGTSVNLLIFTEKLSRGQFELFLNKTGTGLHSKIISDTLPHTMEKTDTLVYAMKGQLAFINAQSHIARFEQKLNGYENVVIRLRELCFMDLDGVDAFNEIVELIRAQGKRVLVSGVNPLIQEMLQESPVFKGLQKEGAVFERTTDALRELGFQAVA